MPLSLLLAEFSTSKTDATFLFFSLLFLACLVTNIAELVYFSEVFEGPTLKLMNVFRR